MMTIDSLHALVGHRFPDGSFTLDRMRHDALFSAIHGPDSGVRLPPGVAHPVFGHLATHCGKGLELEDFFALAGATLDDGVVFGEGKLTFAGQLRIGATYHVRGGISAVERKQGRSGTFDTVTTTLRLDDDRGTTVAESEETFVFPRPAGGAA